MIEFQVSQAGMGLSKVLADSYYIIPETGILEFIDESGKKVASFSSWQNVIATDNKVEIKQNVENSS